ncbi:MAG TPA: flagellar biosynthesis protein FlhB [Stellaceae bacterium]|jgi:flagellar biosynthetic protein FlhB|nr:flagellar biosynthesis protein FlhB [Stellaceae bacterium]
MSDTSGADNRTEKATPRRLERAREEGSVVRAHAVAGAAVLVAGAAMLSIAGARVIELLESSMRFGLTLEPEAMREPARLVAVASQIAWPGLLILAPFMLLLVGVGFLADLMIGGWIVSAKPLAPDFTRIDPLKGFGKLFSKAALAEIVKALVKFVAVGAIAAWLTKAWLADFLHVAAETWPYAPRHVASLSNEMFLILAASLAVVTLFEVPWQLWQHRDQLKMSRQEIKDEQKDQEGSPQTKRRIRGLRVKLARARMMSEVPKADVVVVNPEHFAAALSYREDRMRAPRLVAKGTGLIALRIRAVAEEHGVTVVEAPPLARSINHYVDLGDEIPVGLYRAVAEVLAYVYRLKAARDGGEPRPEAPRDGRFEPPAEFDA